MKKVLSFVAVVAITAFVLLMVIAMTAYPMHIGEPTYFHVARCNCLVAAAICGLVSFISGIVSVHF